MEERTENECQCPYQGIFYTVTDNEENTCVQFVSLLLFELFLNKILADFQLSADVHVYRLNTKKQKKKCHIILDSTSRHIQISEAGHKVWRDEFINTTMPALLSQLVEETNRCHDESSPGAAIAPAHDTILIESDDDADKDKEDVLTVLRELKVQTDQLREEIRSIKPTYSEVCSSNLHTVHQSNSTPVPKKQKNVSNGRSAHSYSEVNNSPTPATRSPRVQSNNVKTQPTEELPIPTLKKNIFLVGDSILSRVNPRGLRYNVHKHSLPGATINSLASELQLYNLSRFDTIILYIGGNDAASHKDIEYIEEQYDQLLTLLKSSNPKIRIILSKIAPRGDADVSILNDIIERLCLHHRVEFVDAFRAFHDTNGMVCPRYISPQDTVHPSSSGIKRILGTINNKLTIVHDFDSVVYVPVAGRRQFGHSSRPVNTRNFAYPGQAVYTGQASRKCLKCGEANHETVLCRHRKPITCWSCGEVGHKKDHCWSLG